jgi:hypothetical protein
MTKKPFDPPPPKECKEASVTAFRAFIWIHSWAVYRASMLDPDGVDADYPPDLGDAELGAAARKALLASRFIPPDHPDWDRVGAYSTREKDRELSERFKARAGVKTEAALYKGAANVSLTLQDGVMSVEPLRYEGRGGFGGIKGVEPTELSETISNAELGAAIRAAIEVSRAVGKG